MPNPAPLKNHIPAWSLVSLKGNEKDVCRDQKMVGFAINRLSLRISVRSRDAMPCNRAGAGSADDVSGISRASHLTMGSVFFRFMVQSGRFGHGKDISNEKEKQYTDAP